MTLTTCVWHTVIEIMTNVAETGDWAEAFAKSIPTRFVLPWVI